MVRSGHGPAEGDSIRVPTPMIWGERAPACVFYYRSTPSKTKAMKTTPWSKRIRRGGETVPPGSSCVLHVPRGIETAVCSPEGRGKIIMENLKHFHLFLGTNDLSKIKELCFKMHTSLVPTLELQSSPREADDCLRGCRIQP